MDPIFSFDNQKSMERLSTSNCNIRNPRHLGLVQNSISLFHVVSVTVRVHSHKRLSYRGLGVITDHTKISLNLKYLTNNSYKVQALFEEHPQGHVANNTPRFRASVVSGYFKLRHRYHGDTQELGFDRKEKLSAPSSFKFHVRTNSVL